MRLENVLKFEGVAAASGIFYACGSFGIINGGCSCECIKEDRTTTYRCNGEDVVLTASFTEEANGVIIRRDCFENLSDKKIEITALSSRFCLDGNDYEVYTQYNGWQHESRGGWQRLVTQVAASSQGIRTCDGAVPMMALHNLHSRRNTVFHILPNGGWKITARKHAAGNKREVVVVEAGFNSENMRLVAEAGEKIYLPEIIFFNAQNKTDLDCYKLHTVYNAMYPRKSMPVVYNSWLYCFDNLDVDALLKQADCAAEMGFEAFMIDAGWFGNGNGWTNSVGDWEENTVSGPKGRLIEISERVRKNGMIFGLWFEPERAASDSRSVKEHPEYYINKTLLDFANPSAVEYMTEAISKNIEKYSIGWLKFDFNATIPDDITGNCFYRYMQGQRRFVEALRKKYPQLYITNCASGGYRMELGQGTMFDSFWLSDNQGPYEGIRIVKDTLKRMPTSLIERWNVQKYAEGFPRYGCKEPVGVMLSCNNATWDFILNVDDSFTKGFINSGPIGFSCDIAAFPEAYKKLWREHIEQFKKDRDFYMNATARILIDTDDITAIQYSDCELTRCIIQVFTKTVYAENLIIYPVTNDSAEYECDGETISGSELSENGIRFENLADNHCYTKELREVV